MSSCSTAPAVAMPKMETRVASPSHFLLKIKPYSLLGKNGINYEYKTGEFNAGGYKWRLIIDFSGKNSNYISAYLAISPGTKSLLDNWEVNAVYSIFLFNQISGNYHYLSGTRRFILVKCKWGFSEFISKEALNDPSNGFVMNDSCVFGVEVFIIRSDSTKFQSLLPRDVTDSCDCEPHWKIPNYSTLGDVWASKQYVFVDECHKWEVCLPTERKGEDYKESGSRRGFRLSTRLLLDAMGLRDCFSTTHHVKHNKTVAVKGTKLETRETSPTHFLMRVESFPLLGKHGIHEIVTGEFDAGGYKWRLIICPSEDKTGKDSNYISVYLAIWDTTSLQPPNWEVNVVFSIFLFNHISGNYHYSLGRTRRFQAMKTKWGISNFISKEALMNPSNGFLIDNKCVFGAEVFIIEKSAVTECLYLKGATYPYKRDWKISNFSKLGHVWISEEFIIDGLTWELCVYPRGIGNEKDRCLSIFIRMTDSQSMTASFAVCIKDQIYKKDLRRKTSSHCYSPNSKSLGWAKFIELATLKDPKNGFIVNDCCLLEIEIFVQAIVFQIGPGSSIFNLLSCKQ